MPHFTDREVLAIIVEQNQGERALSDRELKEQRQCLAEDLHDARIGMTFWKERADRFDKEIKRLRGLLREAGRPDLAEGPDYPCIAQGCQNEAAIGAKVCKESLATHDNLEITLCLVRSCDNSRIHPLTPFCWDHKAQWRDHNGDAFAFMEDLALGRPWRSRWDRLLDEEMYSFDEEEDDDYYEDDDYEEEPPPRYPPGSGVAVPGLGDQVSVHGLPPAVADAEAVGAALSGGATSDLDAPEEISSEAGSAAEAPAAQGEISPDGGDSAPREESPRLCVFAQCGAPRAPGHALCEAHLTELAK